MTIVICQGKCKYKNPGYKARCCKRFPHCTKPKLHIKDGQCQEQQT